MNKIYSPSDHTAAEDGPQEILEILEIDSTAAVHVPACLRNDGYTDLFLSTNQ